MPEKEIIWLLTGNKPTFQGLIMETPKNLELWKKRNDRWSKETIQLLFGLLVAFWSVVFSNCGEFKGGGIIVKRNDSGGLDTLTGPSFTQWLDFLFCSILEV